MTAPLASVFNFLENSSKGMPAIFANVLVSVVILVSNCEKAVDAISSFCMFSSMTAPNPMIWV